MTRLFFFPRPCPSLLTEIILCQVLITDVAVEPGSGSQAGHSIILALFHRCCSVAKLCLTLCEPLDCSTLGFPVLHYLPEFAQTHVHWVLACNVLSVFNWSKWNTCIKAICKLYSTVLKNQITATTKTVQIFAISVKLNETEIINNLFHSEEKLSKVFIRCQGQVVLWKIVRKI